MVHANANTSRHDRPPNTPLWSQEANCKQTRIGIVRIFPRELLVAFALTVIQWEPLGSTCTGCHWWHLPTLSQRTVPACLPSRVEGATSRSLFRGSCLPQLRSFHPTRLLRSGGASPLLAFRSTTTTASRHQAPSTWRAPRRARHFRLRKSMFSSRSSESERDAPWWPSLL